MAKKKSDTNISGIAYEQWDISRIKPYDHNPKTHPEEQIVKLAEHLRTYGFDQPIVVDEAGVIIKGHGRLQAAQRAGLASVPVVVRVGLSEVEKRALRIADNRLAESPWDDEKLLEELRYLHESGDGGLELTGYAENELDYFVGLFADQDEMDTEPEFDPELEHSPATETNEVTDEELWPTISFKVSPETRAVWKKMWAELPGSDDNAKAQYAIHKCAISKE